MTGSCLCGKVRYQADGELTAMHHCHCQRCRKHHGAAFVTDGLVPASGFRWLSGEEEVRGYGAPGWASTRFFCATCGSSLCTRDTRFPEFVIVTAGTLDDDPGVRPGFHIFVASKAPWFTITDDLPQFAADPSDERPR
jgi:hypothetical protein